MNFLIGRVMQVLRPPHGYMQGYTSVPGCRVFQLVSTWCMLPEVGAGDFTLRNLMVCRDGNSLVGMSCWSLAHSLQCRRAKNAVGDEKTGLH